MKTIKKQEALERIRRYIDRNVSFQRSISFLLEQLNCEIYLTGSSIRHAILEEGIYSDCDLIIQNNVTQLQELSLRSSLKLAKNSYGDMRFAQDGVRFDVMSCMSSTELAVAKVLKTFDFSVNQVACELRSGKIIDPCGGVADILQGKLGVNKPAWLYVSDRLLINQFSRLLEILENEKFFSISK